MARPLRIEYAGAFYHVTSRGNEGRPIFRSDRDRKQFLLLLGQVVSRFGWSLSAYVLMTNHYHLLIQTPEPNLSRGMQWLNGAYAGWFNHTRRRSGHLFQGRFHSFLIEKDAYFAETLRYVVLNPVRAKMVESPGDYPWSSYRSTARLSAAPDWLDADAALQAFGKDVTAPMRYQAFVMDKVASTDLIWREVTNAIYLGRAAWVKDMRRHVESRIRSTDHPKVQRAVGRPTMDAIVSAVSRGANVTPQLLQRRPGRALRGLAAWIGWYEGLLTLRSIAAALRLRSEGYVSNIIRSCDRALSSDATLLRHFDAAVSLLR